MKPLTYAQILDASVADRIPESLDLAPHILTRIDRDRNRRVQPKLKLAITILLVCLALLALTTAAYAVYHWIGDPGLHAVQDAGLISEMDLTAQPTILPTQPPANTPLPASNQALSQTLQGVTLTLDWVYLDEGRLAMGMQFTDLPPDTTLGAPQVTFQDVTPVQAQGFSQSIRSDDHQAVYISYQVIQADTVGGKVSLDVDVPLVPINAEEQAPLALFHFDLKDVPVYAGQTIPLQQTYAVQHNGVEVRLKSVRVMPSTTELVACYDFPTQDAPFWYMQHATVQIGDGPEESYRTYQYLSEIQDDHCVKLGFAAGNALGENQLVFRVHQLVVPLTMQDVVSPERIAAVNRELAKEGIEIKPAPASQTEGPGGWQFVRKPSPGTDPTQDPSLLVLQALEEKMDGPWEFYVDIPSENSIPGQATTTPAATPSTLGAQTIEGVTVTLDWVFADAKRVAVGYTVSGLPDIPNALTLNGTITLRDEQENPVGGPGAGSSTIERVEGKLGTVKGSWSASFQEPYQKPAGRFRLDITLNGGSAADRGNVIADFPLPPEATPFPPDVFPPTLPDRMVGTFHFEFDTPVYPMQTLEPTKSVTVNGIEMRIEKIDATASFTRFTLCYAKPSAKDWTIGRQATLKAGEYEATVNSYSLLFDTDYGGYQGTDPEPADSPRIDHGRCVRIDFLLGHSNRAGIMTLTVPVLEQSGPEVIPEAEIQAAQEKLKLQGIELEYTTWTSGGGGGSGAHFTKLPAGMDQQEAYWRFLEALGYLYPGPWVFTLDIQP